MAVHIYSIIALVLLAFVKGTLSINCVVCTGNSNTDCGAPINTQAQTCPNDDHCYTQVSATAGATPYFNRGCGSVSCRNLPEAGSWGERCDSQDRVNIPIKAGENNASYVFRGRDLVTNIQYCNSQGNGCNRGAVQFMNLPGYYSVVGPTGQSSLTQATLLTVVILPIIAKLFV